MSIPGNFIGGLLNYYTSGQGAEQAREQAALAQGQLGALGQTTQAGTQFQPYTVTSGLANVGTTAQGGFNLNLTPQQQAQQQAQDPLVQMQQQELQLKQGELERKAAKDQADNEIARAELELESAKLESDERQALQKLIAEGVSKEGALNVQQLIEGAKLAVAAGKNSGPTNQ